MIALGDTKVHLLSDGSFWLDGGALFGVVPRVFWETSFPPDEKNRVRLALNIALIEAGGKRILVDTGLGDKWGEKERAIYRIDRSETLLLGLARLGIRPEDVDIVINTHLHFDHAGGNTRELDGRIVPTFPRARYVVQLGEWEDATRPHERSRASYIDANYVPLAEARLLDSVQGEVEVCPGVRVVPVGGHTAYHQMVVVEGGDERLIIPTDLLPTASHLPLAYVAAYDLFPMGTLEAKRKLLQSVAGDGAQIVFYHDPKTPVGKIALHKGRYLLAPASH